MSLVLLRHDTGRGSWLQQRETAVDFYAVFVMHRRPTQLLTFANVYIVQLWLHLSYRVKRDLPPNAHCTAQVAHITLAACSSQKEIILHKYCTYLFLGLLTMMHAMFAFLPRQVSGRGKGV